MPASCQPPASTSCQPLRVPAPALAEQEAPRQTSPEKMCGMLPVDSSFSRRWLKLSAAWNVRDGSGEDRRIEHRARVVDQLRERVGGA